MVEIVAIGIRKDMRNTLGAVMHYGCTNNGSYYLTAYAIWWRKLSCTKLYRKSLVKNYVCSSLYIADCLAWRRRWCCQRSWYSLLSLVSSWLCLASLYFSSFIWCHILTSATLVWSIILEIVSSPLLVAKYLNCWLSRSPTWDPTTHDSIIQNTVISKIWC